MTDYVKVKKKNHLHEFFICLIIANKLVTTIVEIIFN